MVQVHYEDYLEHPFGHDGQVSIPYPLMIVKEIISCGEQSWNGQLEMANTFFFYLAFVNLYFLERTVRLKKYMLASHEFVQRSKNGQYEWA